MNWDNSLVHPRYSLIYGNPIALAGESLAFTRQTRSTLTDTGVPKKLCSTIVETKIISSPRCTLAYSSMSEEDGSTSPIGGFDPVVFWSVNAFIFVLLFAACAFYCCCFQGTGNGRPGATESDRVYQDTILRRQREALDKQKHESPLVRQQKIEQAILRYGVRMVSASRCISSCCESCLFLCAFFMYLTLMFLKTNR